MPIPEPPRIVSALIHILTPPSWRVEIAGSLRDGYVRRHQTHGSGWAHVWCWRQLCSLDVVRLWFIEPGTEPDPQPERSGRSGSGVIRDVGFALRTARNAPAFSAVVLLTLALGIGATTAIFSVVNGVLLRPLPYEDPERLVMVFRTVERLGFTRSTASYPDFADWREASTSFQDLAAYSSATRNYSGESGAELWRGWAVTANLMPLLGANAWLGRTVLEEEDQPGAERVILLSHRNWQSRFGGDLQIAGRSITIDGEPVTVVGVMAPEFDFPSRNTDFWVPMRGDAAALERDFNFLTVLGRLSPGLTVEMAQEEMRALVGRIDGESPDGNKGYGIFIEGRHAFVVRNARTALLVFLGAVGLVLAIACTNVANLMLARGTQRRRELALRTALGASGGRLVRQMLTESTVLALGGGVLGLALAWALVRALLLLDSSQIPRMEEVGIDPTVLAFAALVSLGCGVVFGTAPALFGTKTDPGQSLKGGPQATGLGRIGRRFQETLVVVQVGLAMLLAVGAGLLLNSFVQLTSVEKGFDPTNVLASRIAVPPSEVQLVPNPTPGERLRIFAAFMNERIGFYDDLTQTLESLPGVERVGMSYAVPFGGHTFSRYFVPESLAPADGEDPIIDGNVVRGDYFRAMGIPLLKGRIFEETDGPNDPSVIVIDETAARAFWPSQDAVGRRVRIGGVGNPLSTIVGVVADVRERSLMDEPRPTYYRPLAQVNWPDAVFMVVRSAIDPGELVPMLRRRLGAAYPDLPLTDVATADDLIDTAVAAPRLRTVILFTFSALALVLALVGIYGVIAYSVGERRREIGVRMALGAERGDIARMIMSKALGLTLLGIGLGVAGGIAVTRFIEGMLFGVTPYDLTTFAVAGLLLVIVALLASYLPARSAANVDVGVCLRWE